MAAIKEHTEAFISSRFIEDSNGNRNKKLFNANREKINLKHINFRAQPTLNRRQNFSPFKFLQAWHKPL